MAEDQDDDVEAVLDAVIISSPQQQVVAIGETGSGQGRRQLNISAASTIAVALVFLLLAMAFGESIVNQTNEEEFSGEWWNTPLQQRHTMDLPMDTLRAQLPVNGSYEALPYSEHFIEVELPASEQDAGFPGPALMHIALWLPNVPEDVKIPVIMTIHPYYDFGGEGMPGVGDD